jgi:hypothetical protein
MEQIEKVKRNYKKVDLNSVNAITKIAGEKKLNFVAIGNHLNVSHVTAKKLLMQPKLMNGYQRKMIATLFEIDVHEISRMIDSDLLIDILA